MSAFRGLFLFSSVLALSVCSASVAKAEWDFNIEMPDIPNPIGVYEYIESSLFGEDEKDRHSDFEVAKEKSLEEIKEIRAAKAQPVKRATAPQIVGEAVEVKKHQQSVLTISSDYFVPSEVRDAPPVPQQQSMLSRDDDVKSDRTSVPFEPVRLGNDFSNPASLNAMEPTSGLATMAPPSAPILTEPAYETELEPEAEVEAETASYRPVHPKKPQPVSYATKPHPRKTSSAYPYMTGNVLTGNVRRYRALRGANLAEVLDVWAEDAGVEMVWLAGRNFSVINSVSKKATFEEAVVEVLEQYSATKGERPVAQLNTDPETLQKTLIIRTGRI